MKKILTVIGARPQFIKASVVSKAIADQAGLQEVIIHTGQHYDANMSDIFFGELGIPRPDYQLDINGSSHGAMTGRMLEEIERIVLMEKPYRVLVYGDTNSTLAGALAAAKLHVAVAHVEAGLRSFNMNMPEEINRILTDNVSDVLFCPTDSAVKNLEEEGFSRKPVQILKVGDVMQDSALFFAQKAALPDMGPIPKGFVLATVHRAENTDDPKRLTSIVAALNEIHQTIAPVVLPLHPRTGKLIQQHGLELKVHVMEPVGYLQMLALLRECGLVVTDSGGLQKEAYFFGKYCVTLRDETEWVELVESGVNTLVGASHHQIIELCARNYAVAVSASKNLYGNGEASHRIANVLSEY